MKFFHLSDLHLGKRLNEYPLLDEQIFILDRILALACSERPDAVLIAGDIYDKAIPPAEAVRVFDGFLNRLAGLGIPALVISGNHDSPDRLSFGARLMEGSGVHIAGVYNGETQRVTLRDEYGEVDVWLLPFFKPAQVHALFPDEPVETFSQAVAAAVRRMAPDPAKRNVLVAHHFVAGASRAESEEISVGGADQVDAALFDGFDYTALGHLHSPQNCGSARVRYCGTPLKYSFSEEKDEKSVTVVELREKGSLTVTTLPLRPRRDLFRLKGRYEELMRLSFYQDTPYPDALVCVTLTDEELIPDAIRRLGTVYRNILALGYDNKRTAADNVIEGGTATRIKTPLQLFGELYELQNNRALSEAQAAYVQDLIDAIGEEENA